MAALAGHRLKIIQLYAVIHKLILEHLAILTKEARMVYGVACPCHGDGLVKPLAAAEQVQILGQLGFSRLKEGIHTVHIVYIERAKVQYVHACLPYLAIRPMNFSTKASLSTSSTTRVFLKSN